MKKILLFGLLLSYLGLHAQIIEFEDSIFKETIVNRYDLNGDNEIDQTEILNVKNINISSMGIRSIKGVEYFQNLETLDCNRNKLTSIDISNNKKLKGLWCVRNYIEELDISQNTLLTELQCGNNQIKSIDFSKNKELQFLQCQSNQLSLLDVSNNTKLEKIWCNKNQLTILDVSQNTLLNDLNFENNLLTYLNIKNNSSHSTRGLNKYQNPNLITICADFHEVESIKSNSYRHPDLNVTTCSENECNTIINHTKTYSCPLFSSTVQSLSFEWPNIDHNYTWYTDSTFNTTVDPNTILEDKSTYYRKELFGCNSLITSVQVQFNRVQYYPAKTISISYCEKDKKTIQDLINSTEKKWDSEYIYLEKTGGEPISKSTILNNATTYYQGDDSKGDGECWVIERTPIHVILKNCSNLSTSDFEFNDQLNVFPNPVNDILNIQPKNGTTINSITIHNIQGQLLKTLTNPSHTIDVSNLSKGIYIISVSTDKGIATKRLVK